MRDRVGAGLLDELDRELHAHGRPALLIFARLDEVLRAEPHLHILTVVGRLPPFVGG